MIHLKTSMPWPSGSVVLAVLALMPPAQGAEPKASDPKAPITRTAPGTAAQRVKAPKPVINPALDPLPASWKPIPAKPCSQEKVDEVKAVAGYRRPGPDFVMIDCSLTLAKGDVITKRPIFETSGVTLECNDATIDGGRGTHNYRPEEDWAMVEIRTPGSTNVRPQNITLRNCNILGSVKVWGGGRFDYAESMRRERHATRVRNSAPRGVVLDNVTIDAQGQVALYLHAGVSDFQLLNSEIKGSCNGPNIYLDAESYHNTFRNNDIHAGHYGDEGRAREVMSLDGSSYNVIVNNRFSALNHGGIYLYRNCGEKGTIRHSTPSHNTIVNNVFYYDKYGRGSYYSYKRLCPAIYVGSRSNRNDDDCQKTKTYCGADEKPLPIPLGSAAGGDANLDHAQFNVVMQNRIYKLSVDDMIKLGRPDINRSNYIRYNETVTTDIERKAGCYVKDGVRDGHAKEFILDGEFINRFRRGFVGTPVFCTGYTYTCDDGVLIQSGDLTCAKPLPRNLPQLEPQ